MITFLTVLVFSVAVPLACWAKLKSPFILFASALLVYSIYALAMTLTHGWSASYEYEGATVIQHYGAGWLRMLAYFAVPTLVIWGLERIRVRLNHWILVGVFCCLNLSVLILVGQLQIYDGFQYPPIWYEKLNQEQIGFLNLATMAANLLTTLAQWAFLVAIAWRMAPRIPSAFRKLISTIRSF